MSEPGSDGPEAAEGADAGRFTAFEVRAAGVLGSIPVGLAAGSALQSAGDFVENGHMMALALLAIAPFLLALLPADTDGVLNVLGVVAPLGLVSGLITALGIRPLYLLGTCVVPPIIGLALIFGLAALSSGRHGARDGSLALVILGFSPAASCLVVFLLDSLVAQLLGIAQGRLTAPPRPMMVFGVAVAIVVLVALAIPLQVRLSRPAAPSKPKARPDRDGFDLD